jgi:hypothetical protein
LGQPIRNGEPFESQVLALCCARCNTLRRIGEDMRSRSSSAAFRGRRTRHTAKGRRQQRDRDNQHGYGMKWNSRSHSVHPESILLFGRPVKPGPRPRLVWEKACCISRAPFECPSPGMMSPERPDTSAVHELLQFELYLRGVRRASASLVCTVRGPFHR